VTRNAISSSLAALGLAIGLAGCASHTTSPPASSVDPEPLPRYEPSPLQEPSPPAATSHPLADLCLPAGIAERAFCLEAGQWEGEPWVAGSAARPSVRLVAGLEATADLDADGRTEVAGLVVGSSAGSGSHLHLVVARSDGQPTRTIATAPLGDRIQIRDLAAGGGELRLAVVRHGGGDALCCPTEKADLVYILRGGRLERAAEHPRGTISIADLAGVTWRLSRLSRDTTAPTSPEVTLVFAGGRIAGSSSCNRYQGSVEESAPRTIAFGPLAGTRRFCEEAENDLERRFLRALAGIRSYGFAAGELVLSGADSAGDPVALYFTPAP
jgi:putative lipoprotein